jgi:hypothetical protein
VNRAVSATHEAIVALEAGDSRRALGIPHRAVRLRHVCPHCGARFDFPGLLDVHRLRRHGIEDNR